jgi:hypothetical protein
LLTDPARQIWNSFNNRANAGGADAPEAAVNGCLYDRFKSLYTKTATKPSLVIVPARFKSGTLYSQIPSSNADFTVTRALNTATRFDSSALIQTGITSGIPRLDYYTSGGTAGCPALLVEPAATNLVLQSEAFNVSGTWVGSSGGTGLLPVITANNAVSPDGNQTADKIDLSLNSGNTLSDISWIYQNNTLSSGQIYAGSVWLKAATQADVGKVIQVGYVSYQSYTLTADWVRITLTQTPSITQNYSFGFRLRGAQGTANSASLYLWGAQLETGSVATSYIPTTAGTGSRSADVVSVSGAVSGSIGQTEGTIYAEVDFRQVAAGTIFVLDDGDPSDFINILKQSNLTISVRLRRASGTIVTIITSSAVALGVHKIALVYKNGDYALYIDGVSAGTSTNSTDYPATALVQCVLSNTNYGPLNDRIRAAALYTTRLTNAELALITQP